MIENTFVTQFIVSDYIEENNIQGEVISLENGMPSVDVGTMFEINEDEKKFIYYGQVNDIINTEEFKQWYKKKGNVYE